MGLKDIISALEEEARVQREEIMMRGRNQADQIIEEARRKSEQSGCVEEARLLEAAKAQERHIIRQAVFLSHAAKNAARASLVNQVLEKAQERLRGIQAAPEYPDIFKRLVVNAWDEAAVLLGEKIIIVDPSDLELAGAVVAELPGGPELVAEDIEGGGVMIASKDGRHRLINTVQGRLDRARPHITAHVARILFNDD